MFRGALDCQLVASEKDMATLCADCGRASGRAGGSLVAERAALIESIVNRLSARRAKLFATLASVHEKQLQRQLRSAMGKPTSALENPRFDRISSGRTPSAALGDRDRDQWARDGYGYGDQKQQRGVGGFEDAALRRRQVLERLDLLRNLRLPAQDEQQPDLGALGGERERAEKAAQQQSLDCLALLEAQWEPVRFHLCFHRDSRAFLSLVVDSLLVACSYKRRSLSNAAETAKPSRHCSARSRSNFSSERPELYVLVHH